MEKFFKPVHCPLPPDEIKPRKNPHHHHFYHHQDMYSHRYAMLDDIDRNTDDSQGHFHQHQHSQYHRDGSHRNAHYPHQLHHDEENETIFNHHTPVTLSRASSSSLSSSSSTSSYSSWYTETSANDPVYLRYAERPQHSLSCSNIPDVRRGFREDDSSGPVVFATIKHNRKGNVCSGLNDDSEQSRNFKFSSLNRGHSRSDEGFLQCNEGDDEGEQSKSHINYGPLYKSASLNRNLALSEEDFLLGVPKGPKRAISSCQLPSKGILKNKENSIDIRKAKSMEVLSPRVTKGEGQSGQKGKGITQAEIEQARANFVEGKLQFSAFLDEITKQVMSPSDLTILGVHNNKTPEKTSTSPSTSDPVKPQLPPKKHKTSASVEMAPTLNQPSKQAKACSSSRKYSDGSNPDKLITYTSRDHDGSPPPRQHQPSGGQGRKERRPSPTGSYASGDRYNRYNTGPHLTDGTSTSPEPSHPKQRHHRKHQSSTFHNQPNQPPQSHQQMQEEFENQRPSISPLSSIQGAAGPGFGSESSSTKSDSSRARDTASTATSHSSEQSGRHQSQHAGVSKQHRDTLFDADHLQELQEENADLHQNLLQTVVCIESLEAELQRTRDELSHVKEKYKSFLQIHTGTKQANNLLGEHLHIASESLNSERKYLLNRVSQLGSELEDAHRTIAALENINVPCLIKDLLEKQFNSAEAIQKFLTTSSQNNPSQQADSQLHPPKEAEEAHGGLTGSDVDSQRFTAFLPFKHDTPANKNEGSLSGQHESGPSFSVADISAAIYKKMSTSYPARPLPIYPQNQKQPSKGTNHGDVPPDPQHAHVSGDSWRGRGGLKVLLLEQDVGDVDSASAQQILDGFMQHLQAHKEAAAGTEQQSGKEWASGVKQTGNVAD